jgi:UDP-2-acetamido-3-amino-2,3-dideoxy-glucuronate N-acetyltransferase
VITKPVLDFALVVGNPGKQIGWVSKAGIRLDFDNDNTAQCSESGDSYILQNGTVSQRTNS